MPPGFWCRCTARLPPRFRPGPVDHGVDLVIRSLTKFINGHGDALGGAVIGRNALISRLRARSGVCLGATLSAQNAWLILRGIDTLFPRLRAACDNALHLAQWLQGHPAVTQLIYRGMPSHLQHALAQRKMVLGGGIICFQSADPQAMAAHNCPTVCASFAMPFRWANKGRSAC